MYSERMLDYFYNPRNVGVIKGADGMGKAVSNKTGDIVKLYIKVENQEVIDAKFQTYGSAGTIALSSVATELVLNKNVEDLLKITSTDITDIVGGMPQDKRYCADIVKEAIDESVYDYRRKLVGEKKPRKKKSKE